MGTDRRISVGGWSRSVSRSVRLASVSDRPAFLSSLREELRGGGYDVLLPGSDASLAAISHGRDGLEPFVGIGLPCRAAVNRSLDKASLIEVARGVGMPCPATVLCDSCSDVTRAGMRLGYPFVIKPASPLSRKPGGGRRSATLVDSPAAAVEAANQLDQPFLAQRYEPGVVVWVSGVYAAGRLRALGGGRFVRAWPPGLGSASKAVSFLAPRQLRERVVELLRALGWSGIFQLQLVEHGTRYSPIDLNPRVFGSLALDVAAGANLPAVWCNSLVGDAGAFEQTHERLAFSWEEGELRNSLAGIVTGSARRDRHLADGPRPLVRAHLKRDDPGPALACALNLAAKIVARGYRSAGRPKLN